MGRLQTVSAGSAGLLLLALASGLLACEENPRPPAVTRERSQAIGAVSAAAPAATTAAAVTAAASAPKRPRKALCQGALRDGKALPKARVSRAAASSDGLPPEAIASRGRWTWVNFWAAWCAPCKEEIPRLKAWEGALSGHGLRVVFVSLDDDARQLGQFLTDSAELKQTYWLREGKERDDWMSAAALGTDPELPFHLLVDPDNEVRCRVQGAVEDEDLADLKRLLAGE